MKNLNYKLLCWVAAFFACASLSYAQGPTPQTATPINCGGSYIGNTSGSPTTGAPGSCSGVSTGSNGVWYLLVGTGGQVSITTCNSVTNYDTKLHVYNGFPGLLSCETANDDMGFSNCSFSSLRSEVTFNTMPGTLYYVLVNGFLSRAGDFQIDVTCNTSTVPNDDCAGAIAVNCGDVVSGSTANATTDGAAFCGTSNTANGVWYSVQGNGSLISATTCSPGTNFDTKLSVFSGSCTSLSCVAGNDDMGFSNCSSSGLQSQVDWVSSVGTTYYILVHGFSSNSGDFDLTISCPSPPANDDACNAQAVTFGATSFTNIFASAQSGEVDPGGGTGTSSCNSQDGWCSFETDVDNSVWFTFTAPASGCVSIVADGFDSQVALYSVTDCADFNTYTEIAANDDGGDDIQPGANSLSGGIDQASCLTPGATYYIQVDGYNGAESSNGTLTITDCGGQPLAVDAGDCQSRFIGYAPAEADTNFLYANASGGEAPYTFTWSPSGLGETTINGGTTGVLAAQPATSTTYTVTVTDARGCTATSTVDVNVIDVNAPCATRGNTNKVQICHIPPGNPGNARELCVDDHAVATHLGHGDNLGPCGNPCDATNPSVVIPVCVDLTLNLTTDRFASETSWQLVDVTNNQIIDEAVRFSLTNSTSYSTTYCVDNNACIEFRIQDSFGDGICCTFGTGEYSITYNGNVVVASNSGNNPFSGSSRTESVGACSNKNASQSGAEASLEEALKLSVFPNPAAEMANFKFMSPVAGMATIEVFSMTGARVATVFNGNVEANTSYNTELNASTLPAGAYIYKLSVNDKTEVGKLFIGK